MRRHQLRPQGLIDILRCARDRPLHTTSKPCLLPNTGSYSTLSAPPFGLSVLRAFTVQRVPCESVVEADLRSDRRRLFGFSTPWYAVKGEGKMTISMPNAFDLDIVVRSTVTIYNVSLLRPFQGPSSSLITAPKAPMLRRHGVTKVDLKGGKWAGWGRTAVLPDS